MAHLIAHPSGVVLIHESFVGGSSGLPLLHLLVDHFASKKQLYFLVVEHSREFHKQYLKLHRNTSIQYIDCHSNPRKWEDKTGTNDYNSLQNTLTGLNINKATSIFAIDSLSPLIFQHGIENVCRFLHQLKTKFSITFCLLHTDLHHEDFTSKQLEYIYHHPLLLSTILPSSSVSFIDILDLISHISTYQLNLSEVITTPESPNTHKISILHKRVSGKVTDVVEYYHYNQAGQLVLTNNQRSSAKHTAKTANEEEDPAANLTFNLKLTPQERSAREEVLLPYIHQEHSAPTVDEDEEYEEDPDDDLDI